MRLRRLLGRPGTKGENAASDASDSSAPWTSDDSRVGRLSPPGSKADGRHDGRMYFDWTDTVKQLKREGDLDGAIELLRHCADAVEDESRAKRDWSAAPWYFEQLAICFSKQRDFESEVAILDRYLALPGATNKLAGRRAKALAKLDRAE